MPASHCFAHHRRRHAMAAAAALLLSFAITAVQTDPSDRLASSGDTSMLSEGFLKARHVPRPSEIRTGAGDSWAAQTMNSFLLSPEMATMEGFVLPKGYILEQHDVTTEDGYITTNFRIPHGRGVNESAKPGPPVLLLHGISLSSVCWVINEPDESLAFLLADKGYDVWMFNTRGNTFSRGHSKYGTTDTRYWRFAMDEMAVIDLPATILYIQQVTGYLKVALVGHSQGGTLAFMMLSRLPHFNDRVSVNVGLAPVTYVRDITSRNMIAFCRLANMSHVANALVPAMEHFPMSKPVHDLIINGMCQTQPFQMVCTDVTISLFGKSTHIEGWQYRRYWHAWPSATSYWNAMHWSQMYNEPEERLFAFNYGPDYQLDKVSAPCVVLTGGQDVLAPPAAMERTKAQLTEAGSLAGSLHTPDYGHMDYIWDAKGAKDSVYPYVLDRIEKYSSVG